MHKQQSIGTGYQGASFRHKAEYNCMSWCHACTRLHGAAAEHLHRDAQGRIAKQMCDIAQPGPRPSAESRADVCHRPQGCSGHLDEPACIPTSTGSSVMAL